MLARVLAISIFVSSYFALPACAQVPHIRKALLGGVSARINVPAEAKPDSQIDRLLRALEGTWSITEVLAPDASAPKGKTGVGTIIWRPGPGGYSVIEEYRSKQEYEVVTGLAVFWWEEAAQGYSTIWCDSTNPGGCIDFKNAAKWEGSQLVLQENYVVHAKSYTFEEVFGDITADTFTQTLHGGEVGSPLKVDQTIHAKRVSPGVGPGPKK